MRLDSTTEAERRTTLARSAGDAIGSTTSEE
jgi:hypothetical protein